MTLEKLGFNSSLQEHRISSGLESFDVGRVGSEHRERYVVLTENGEFDAELLGSLRYSAETRFDYPAVGDWVAITAYDENKALIHAIYPRKSVLERTAVGSSSQKQLIATNIDGALIVQAADRDFSLSRLERYLTICNQAGIRPIIVLSKTDLVENLELNNLVKRIDDRIKGSQIFLMSNQDLTSYQELFKCIEKGKTYCMLGSSGVGKSTLINILAGEEIMKTGAIGEGTNRGKHVTTHRELIILDNGSIFIDNPGMREVGIADASQGMEATFTDIFELARECRFKDCTHIHEKGCAVLEALGSEELDHEAFENFQKMIRERAHFETSVREKREKDKSLGKLYKSIQKERRSRKF